MNAAVHDETAIGQDTLIGMGGPCPRIRNRLDPPSHETDRDQKCASERGRIFRLGSFSIRATLRRMQKVLRYRHRVITEENLVFIRELIALYLGPNRWALSKKLCETWNWVQANGGLRDIVCRGMMLMLHRRGAIELPLVRRVARIAPGKRNTPVRVEVEQTPLQSGLAELGPLQVRQVRRRPKDALYNSLMQQHITRATRSPWASICSTWSTRRVDLWPAWPGVQASAIWVAATATLAGAKSHAWPTSTCSRTTPAF